VRCDEQLLAEGFTRQRRRRNRRQGAPRSEWRRRAEWATVALARRLSRTNSGYRELYGEVRTWGLDTIPPLSRDRLRTGIDLFTADTGIDTAAADRFLADPFILGSRFNSEYVLFATSGSSGQRIHVPYHLRDLARSLEAFHWRTVPRPRSATRRLLYIGLLDRHNGGNAWMYYLGQIMDVQLDDVFADPRALLTKILTFRPDVIVTRPHVFVQIGRAATAKGVALPPARLISVGEPLQAGQREDISRHWEQRPHNSYSTVETGPVAFESEPASDYLDVYDDLHLVEILDEENRPVTEPGVTGQVTITTLYRESFPLIRYQPGDLVQWCDRGLGALSRPLGRVGTALALRWPGRTAEVPDPGMAARDRAQRQEVRNS
jgi:phenylacetate-CoA ligase